MTHDLWTTIDEDGLGRTRGINRGINRGVDTVPSNLAETETIVTDGDDVGAVTRSAVNNAPDMLKADQTKRDLLDASRRAVGGLGASQTSFIPIPTAKANTCSGILFERDDKMKTSYAYYTCPVPVKGSCAPFDKAKCTRQY